MQSTKTKSPPQNITAEKHQRQQPGRAGRAVLLKAADHQKPKFFNRPEQRAESEDIMKTIEMTNNQNYKKSITNKAIDILERRTDRSAWDKAVTADAIDFIDNIQQNIEDGYMNPDDLRSSAMIEKALLNGADSWNSYSWGGCGLIYDYDIARHYCTPSELRKTRDGERRPNSREEWLDVQARALFQAANRVKRAIKQAIAELESQYGDDLEY